MKGSRRKFYSIKSKIKKKLCHPVGLFFFPVCTHTPKHIKVFLKLLLVGQLSGWERSSQKRSWLWSVTGKILWNNYPLEQQHKPHHMLSTTNMFTSTQLAVLREFMQTDKQSIQKPRLTSLWSQKLRCIASGKTLNMLKNWMLFWSAEAWHR